MGVPPQSGPREEPIREASPEVAPRAPQRGEHDVSGHGKRHFSGPSP